MTYSTRNKGNKSAPTSKQRVLDANSNFLHVDQDEINKLSEESKTLLSLLNVRFDMLHSRLEEKDAKISKLEREVSLLHEDLTDLKEKLDEVEANDRRNTIILSGEQLPPVTTGENVTQVAMETVKEKINYVIPATDVYAAFRLGKKKSTQAVDNRPIMIKLIRPGLSNDVLHACRTVKPLNFYVNENLTPARSRILFALRHAKRRFPDKIASCGSREGRIYVWMKSQSPNGSNTRVFIDGNRRLEELFSGSFGMTVDELLNSVNRE